MMRFGYLISAFLFGCVLAVFMKTNSPHSATAENPKAMDDPVVSQDNRTATSVEAQLKVVRSDFGRTKSGEPINHYHCTNSHGYVLELIDLGASIAALRAPDRNGKLENLTLGCSDLDGYETQGACFGATIGRFANRIAGAKFVLNDREYQLTPNSGKHHIHGGRIGFNKHVWRSEPIETGEEVGARFYLSSADGDEGYPGNVDVQVEYTLNNDNELRMEYTATTDQPTPINLTNHAYWNLAGATAGTIDDHQLIIDSDKILAVDKDSIPVAEASVAETPFDFRQPHTIGSRMAQIGNDPNGYDHCYVLRNPESREAAEIESDSNPSAGAKDETEPSRESVPTVLAAIVREPKSGRTMELYTNQPGMQFYTGNYLNGQPGSGGFEQHQGFCFETQAFPDAVNRSDFPSAIVKPGEVYRHLTVLKFGVE